MGLVGTFKSAPLACSILSTEALASSSSSSFRSNSSASTTITASWSRYGTRPSLTFQQQLDPSVSWLRHRTYTTGNRSQRESQLSVTRALDRDELLNALWSGVDDATPGTFACGGEVDGAAYQLPTSLWLEGLGELPLPLSMDDASRVRQMAEQAPYGRGADTVVDTAVRQAWQVDATRIVSHPGNTEFLTRTVPSMAAAAFAQLGQDAAQLQLVVNPHKLLYYERGGHFKSHQDTEKEKGMFGTLIVQLPTQCGHEGGALLVNHRGTTKLFDSSVRSSTRFYQMAFFADCKHKLEKITSGVRLCLAFNLVRRGPLNLAAAGSPGFWAAVSRVEAALLPWVQGLEAGGKKPEKLAIPLEHKYTNTNLSFARLKGKDCMVADLLRFCGSRNDTTSVAMELFLCTITLYKWSTPDYMWGEDDDTEEKIEVNLWVGIDDRPLEFSHFDINMESEVVLACGVDTPFGDEADEEEHEGYMGNHGPSDEFWYHVTVLVIIPRSRSMSLACNAGFSGALDILERQSLEKAAEAAAGLQQLLGFCASHPGKVWGEGNRDHNHAYRLLNLCLEVGGCSDVLRLLGMLGRDFEAVKKVWCERTHEYQVVKEDDWYEGISGVEVAKVLALAVQKHGWDACGTYIQEKLLLESRVLKEAEYYAGIALHLESLGCHDAAILIARKTLALVSPVDILKDLQPTDIAAIASMLFSVLPDQLTAFVDGLKG